MSNNYMINIPNVLFDLMPEMKEAELRCVIAIVQWKELTVSELVEKTGMSRQGVTIGIEAGCLNETLKKAPGMSPSDAKAFVSSKHPQKYPSLGKIKRCAWCKGDTLILHAHHYPITREDGGTETVNICANCHAEYHALTYEHYRLGPAIEGTEL